MMIDVRSLPPDEALKTQICIVGREPASSLRRKSAYRS